MDMDRWATANPREIELMHEAESLYEFGFHLEGKGRYQEYLDKAQGLLDLYNMNEITTYEYSKMIQELMDEYRHEISEHI